MRTACLAAKPHHMRGASSLCSTNSRMFYEQQGASDTTILSVWFSRSSQKTWRGRPQAGVARYPCSHQLVDVCDVNRSLLDNGTSYHAPAHKGPGELSDRADRGNLPMARERA